MNKVVGLSLYQQHVERWRDCADCDLCEGRNKIVLARGKVPCDLVLIGEAPGESENVLGVPFMGPAGKLLDHILRKSVPPNVTYSITNLVACIPRDDDGGKATEPDDDSVRACAPRLQEFVEIANPQLIVCVGKLATDWLDPQYKHNVAKGFHKEIPTVDVTHPAAILRMNVAQQGLAVRRVIVTIRSGIEEFVR